MILLTGEGRVRVHEWVAERCRTKDYRRFVDLHLDDVEAAFAERSTWFGAAIAVVDAAGRSVRRLSEPVQPAVGFSLQGGSVPVGFLMSEVKDLLAQSDDSPPSLYLFDPGEAPWENDRDCVPWPPPPSWPDRDRLRFFAREWTDPVEGEFRRSFWISLDTIRD
jgi:hypothetical protein